MTSMDNKVYICRYQTFSTHKNDKYRNLVCSLHELSSSSSLPASKWVSVCLDGLLQLASAMARDSTTRWRTWASGCPRGGRSTVDVTSVTDLEVVSVEKTSQLTSRSDTLWLHITVSPPMLALLIVSFSCSLSSHFPPQWNTPLHSQHLLDSTATDAQTVLIWEQPDPATMSLLAVTILLCGWRTWGLTSAVLHTLSLWRCTLSSSEHKPLSFLFLLDFLRSFLCTWRIVRTFLSSLIISCGMSDGPSLKYPSFGSLSAELTSSAGTSISNTCMKIEANLTYSTYYPRNGIMQFCIHVDVCMYRINIHTYTVIRLELPYYTYTYMYCTVHTVCKMYSTYAYSHTCVLLHIECTYSAHVCIIVTAYLHRSDKYLLPHH